MTYNISGVQRNGLKIDEREVNDIVTNILNECVFRHYFLQYFTIYKVYIISHSHDVFMSLKYQTKITPKSHRIHKGN